MSEESIPRRVGRLFIVNPDSILGLMMFGVVLVLQDAEQSPPDLAIVSLAGVFALWIAHVFAHTIAGYDATRNHTVTVRASFRHSVNEAWAMFAWSAPSAGILFIAPLFGWSSELATNVSLAIMMAMLFIFGFLVFAYRGRPLLTRFVGATATCAVGLVVVIVELLVRAIH